MEKSCMNVSRRLLLPALVACALLIAADKDEKPHVELRVVKYEEMGRTIKDLKGKIVVVDFWQDT
jgi:hypothetical protein